MTLFKLSRKPILIWNSVNGYHDQLLIIKQRLCKKKMYFTDKCFFFWQSTLCISTDSCNRSRDTGFNQTRDPLRIFLLNAFSDHEYTIPEIFNVYGDVN